MAQITALLCLLLQVVRGGLSWNSGVILPKLGEQMETRAPFPDDGS